MRIIYLANARIPTEKAHGLQIFRMCESFSSIGNNVELIVPRRKNILNKDPFDFYASKRNFDIKFVPVLDLFKFGKFGFWITTTMFYFLTIGYLCFKKTDLVFTRDEILATLSILIGKRVVWESHVGSNNVFARFVLRFAGKTIVISEGLESFYLSNGYNKNKIKVLHDAVRPEDFVVSGTKSELRKEFGISENSRVIMYTGHLYDWKGADILASASTKLPNFDFIFVGGTKSDLEHFQSKYTNQNINFVGFVENKFIPRYLKAADLLVIPNINSSDVSAKFTSPLKMFEYIASGTPILASDLQSLKQIGKHSVLYFKSGDVDSLVGKIRDFFANMQNYPTGKPVLYSWDERAKDILECL